MYLCVCVWPVSLPPYGGLEYKQFMDVYCVCVCVCVCVRPRPKVTFTCVL